LHLIHNIRGLILFPLCAQVKMGVRKTRIIQVMIWYEPSLIQ